MERKRRELADRDQEERKRKREQEIEEEENQKLQKEWQKNFEVFYAIFILEKFLKCNMKCIYKGG